MMLVVIRQFHDDMPACVRLDDGECSGISDIDQSLRQGSLLSPLLFNISCSGSACGREALQCEYIHFGENGAPPVKEGKGGEDR